MPKIACALLIVVYGSIFIDAQTSKCSSASRICNVTSNANVVAYQPEKTRNPNFPPNVGCHISTCPQICVECLADCPVQPDCPEPLEYCNNIEDTCKRPEEKDLADYVDPCQVKNPCSCLGRSLGRELILCPPVLNSSLCNSHCGWSLSPDSIECSLEEAVNPITQADAPIMLATYLIPSVTIIYYLIFKLYANSLQDKFHKGKRATIVPDLEVMEKQFGFREHPIGTLLFCLVLFTSAWSLWMVLVIILENARIFPNLALGDTTLGLFSNPDNMTEWFVLIWNVTFGWNLVMILNRYNFRNKFRLPCSLDQATVIGIWKTDPVQIIIPDSGCLHRFFEEYHRLKTKQNKGGKLVLCTVLILDSSSDGKDVAMKPTNKKSEQLGRYFIYNLQRYIFSRDKRCFLTRTITVGITNQELHSKNKGLSTAEVTDLSKQTGANEIAFEIPTIFTSMINEFLTPLYLYQWGILWLWYWQYNWRVALPITGIIFASGLLLIWITRQNAYAILDLIRVLGTTAVLRDGKIEDIPHRDLLPGDIVKVKNGVTGADMVVLNGTAVVDESMLTGEATPVQKTSIPNDSEEYYGGIKSKKHTIFAGTPVTNVPNDQVLAIVVRTGPDTEKGQLVRQILEPVPVRFKFNDHILLTYFLLFCWGIAIACTIAVLMGAKGDLKAWFWGMWAIKQSINPLLPTIFVMAQSVGGYRLTQRKILATQPNKICLAGKVRVCCFDKTGTLTKQGLDFIGAIPTKEGEASFLPPTTDMDALPTWIQEGFSSCHSVSPPIIPDGAYVGNLVDVQMFEATGSQLRCEEKSRNIDHPKLPLKLEVLKEFEFDHSSMTMSVIVQRKHVDQDNFAIFAKGSFESIKKKCNPLSIPEDYDQVSTGEAKKGGYVLGLAYKVISADDVGEFRTNRAACEKDLTFLALFMFQNKLKEDTADAIALLKDGDCRCTMITGDNILTGVYIAKECGLINAKESKVLYGSVGDGQKDTELKVMEEGTQKRGSESENLLAESKDNDVIWKTEEGALTQIPDDVGESTSTYELAVSGAAFRILVRKKKLNAKLLQGIRVFARMTPQDKIDCVYKHMELLGITSMCGDGGNDCGALRVAHVGLALSDSEASIVAPFTGQLKSVQQMVGLILEGRATLATTFATYRFMIMFTLITCTAKLINGYFIIEYSPISWVFLDLAYVAILLIGILAAAPGVKLGPRRPTSSLFGPTTVSSILGASVINFIFIIGVLVHLENQSLPGGFLHCKQWDPSYINLIKWWSLYWNYESQVVCLTVVWQGINAAVLVNFGSAFRAMWIKNYLLIFFLMFLYFVTLYTLFDPIGTNFSCFFSINCPYMRNQLPSKFRLQLFSLMCGNLAALVLWETLVVIGPVGNALRKRKPRSLPIKI